MIQVKTFFAYNELRNFSYLLYEDTTGDAWVIDPYEASPIIHYIRTHSLTLQGILNTHQHFDHTRGNEPLLEAFSPPVKKLFNSEKVGLNAHSYLEVLDTPGHTMDHQVFILKTHFEAKALFSGDTLFQAGVGNCKNGGDVNQLYQTTMRLAEGLPGEILIYPGHDYAQRNLEFALSIEPDNREIRESLKRVVNEDVEKREILRLSSEKSVNPFFRLSSGGIREKFAKEIKELDDEAEIKRNLFHKLRSLRDRW